MASIDQDGTGQELGADRLELLQGGAQVFDDLGGDRVRVREGGGILQAFVAEPEDVQADLVALEQLVVGERAPAAVRVGIGPGRGARVAIGRVVAGDELIQG
jgi:hypothetical protein